MYYQYPRSAIRAKKRQQKFTLLLHGRSTCNDAKSTLKMCMSLPLAAELPVKKGQEANLFGNNSLGDKFSEQPLFS